MEREKEFIQTNTNRRNNSNNLNNQSSEIDLLELFFALKHNIVNLLIGLFAGTLVAGIYTQYFITPQYTATASIFVYSSTTLESLTSSINIGTSLTGDYQYLANTHEVAEDVINNLNLDMSTDELLAHVSVNNPSNTNILEISATSPDPDMAADISNSVANTMRERIADVVDTNKPAVASVALVPTQPSTPNWGNNIIIGGMLGAFIVAALVTIDFIMDDTIKSADDVKRYLNIQVLATLPMDTSVNFSNEVIDKKK